MITITPLAGPSARVVREESNTEGEAAADGENSSALVISSTGEAHPSSPAAVVAATHDTSSPVPADGVNQEREPPKVSAYLLQIDDIRVLVDCGSTEDFVFPSSVEGLDGKGKGKGKAKVEGGEEEGDAMDTEGDEVSDAKKKQMQQVTELSGPLDEILERIAPTIDLLLLSHSTLNHLGLFAYARARLGLKCPVFATMPVQAMGKLTVLECTEALRAELDVEAENKRRATAAENVSGSEGGGANGSTTTIEPEKKVMTVGGAAVAAASALSGGTTAATLSQQLDDDERARAEAKAALKKVLGSEVNKKRERCIPSVDEIEEAFEAITTVRYLQPTHLVEGKLVGMSLTAYSAGHSLGGTVWKIRSPLSGTILLALEYNHNRERHLDGTALLASSGAAANAVGALAGTSAGASTGGVLDAVRRADVLVTDISRGLLTNAKRKDKDAALLSLIDRTLKSGNSLFFPVDPSARLLELLILFDQHWAYAYTSTAPNSSNNPNLSGGSSPPKYPLCLISKTGKEMLQRARTFMEWMTREGAGSPAALAAAQAAEEKERNEKRGGGNQRRWGQQRDRAGPLEFRYLRVFTSIEAMDEVIPLNTPKVVMAVPPSLTHGPSRRLVQRFADKEDDVIVLTHRGEPESLARWLWNQWDDRGEGLGKGGKGEWMKGKVGSEVGLEGLTYRLELLSEVPLIGDELRLYQEVHKASLEKTAQQRLVQARQRRTLEADEDDSDSDDSDSGSEDDGDDFGELGGSAIRGGGFAEPGSSSRKRVHAVAFGAAANERGRGTAAMDAQNEGDGVSTTLSFDIYLKGNASRAAGGFFGTRANIGAGGEDGRSIRFRMFPFVERKRRVDAFGEVVDVGRWLNKQRAEIEKQAGTKAKAPETEEQIKQRKILADRERARLAPPTKFSSETIEVAFRCKLAFVEMEGLNDGKAHKLLIPQLFPRRLVLVNGDEPTRQDMLDSMRSIKGFTKEITAPTKGVTVRIGEMTHSFTVNLGDGILQALKMSRFEDYEMAHVTARVTVSADSAIPTLEVIGPNGVIAISDVLDTAAIEAAERNNEAKEAAKKTITAGAQEPSEEVDQEQKAGNMISKAMFASHPTRTLQPTLFIGDLRLSVLKSILARDFRIPSEFAGEGMLVCGTPASTGGRGVSAAAAAAKTTEQPTVTVQKEGEGRVVLEGNVGAAFYAVRRAVFGLHAQVSE
ncbi:hypothetical protein CF326_g1779 [Tilletia indica]|nr:hypothetical protein CF326_g1779 [Tilletia indica]